MQQKLVGLNPHFYNEAKELMIKQPDRIRADGDVNLDTVANAKNEMVTTGQQFICFNCSAISLGLWM